MAALDQKPLAARVALRMLPESLQSELNFDESFYQEAAIERRTQIAFQPNGPTFDAQELYASVINLFGADAPCEISDAETSDVWSVRFAAIKSRLVKVAKDDTSFAIPFAFALDPISDRRLEAFQRMATEYELLHSLADAWKERLIIRALSIDEISELERDLADTPAKIEQTTAMLLNQPTIELTSMVPLSVKYYQHLIGVHDNSVDIAQYFANEGRKAIIERIRDGSIKSVARCLQMSGHSLAAKTLAVELADREIEDIYIGEADVISRIGYIELLCAHPNAPLIHIARESEKLRISLSEGRHNAAALSSLFTLVDGQLIRSGVLVGLPPFWRRLAALAHTSALLRIVSDQFGSSEEFHDRVAGLVGPAFTFGTLLDLFDEPRWFPSLANPNQFVNEIIGRLFMALSSLQPRVSECAELEGEITSVRELMEQISVAAFLPGPCEGGLRAIGELLPTVRVELAQRLAQRPVILDGFLIIYNYSILYGIPDDMIQLTLDAIRDVKSSVVDASRFGEIARIIPMLSHLAATARNADIADEVRILCRIARWQNPPLLDPTDELQTILMAAASRQDRAGYLEMIGGWSNELSRGSMPVEAALALNSHLRVMTDCAPNLWASIGPAIAATEARGLM